MVAISGLPLVACPAYPGGYAYHGGQCPADLDHPRRCKARAMHSGQRCRQWALSGRTCCKFHGGRRSALAQGGYLDDLPVAYRKLLGPTLQARLDEFIGSKSHAEQLELYEEIALARTVFSENLPLISAVIESKTATVESKATAMAAVSAGLQQIADLCARASAIEKNMADKVSTRQLGLFVQQLTRIIYERVGDTPLAKELAGDFSAKLRLPSDPDADGLVEIKYEG